MKFPENPSNSEKSLKTNDANSTQKDSLTLEQAFEHTGGMGRFQKIWLFPILMMHIISFLIALSIGFLELVPRLLCKHINFVYKTHF